MVESCLKERLQKIISDYGLASRRAAEKMIQDGHVKVNGFIAEIGMSADPAVDQITIDGMPLREKPKKIYLMLNKPRGYVTTMSDEKGRKTVAELISDAGARVLPVGRLDLNSEGLLLMTNDGELIKTLTHPSYEVEKTYLAWVLGNVDEALPVLKEPMRIDGVLLRRAAVDVINGKDGDATLKFVIHEGRNRQIRKMCMNAGLTVTRLKRIAEGNIGLGDLQPGRWRFLSAEEISYLLSLVKRSAAF
jgi:23S rRNA pseudouridine2605 synthase